MKKTLRVSILIILYCHILTADAQWTPAGTIADLMRNVGRAVQIEGRISDVIWQHLVGSFKTHPHEEYFDFGGSQIVIYAKDAISCKDRIRIRGVVVKITGSSKNPARKEIHDAYHVKVEQWECI